MGAIGVRVTGTLRVVSRTLGGWDEGWLGGDEVWVKSSWEDYIFVCVALLGW